ncbi:hypothetical protein [Chitinophaga sancti]|uniref:hypothetical protein n=1 Tax=Chitinophaga sancti TaxID=1004 RepID=UPI003F78D2C1
MTANKIIQHIFQLPDIKQVDEHSIDRIISQYPYFTAARLLLARKQYCEQKNLLAPAVKKAQQFSNNMHYFYRFITTDEVVVEPVVAAPYESGAETAEADAYEAPDYGDTITEEPAYGAEVTEGAAYESALAETPADVYEAPFVEESEEITTFTSDDELHIGTDNVTVTPEEPEPEVIKEQIKEEEQEMVPEPIIVASDLPATITGEEVEKPFKIFPLEMPALEDSSTLTFQPLYTDDYFAYKRLKDPEKADELSEKGRAEMKSFTSWLKDMKTSFADKASKDWYRQQINQSYQDADPEVSEAVEKMAMSSITLNNDMVTETLAEVWAKQRQYNTAILIYQKLSLLNPGKSAYFAQKIKELQILTDKN